MKAVARALARGRAARSTGSPEPSGTQLADLFDYGRGVFPRHVLANGKSPGVGIERDATAATAVKLPDCFEIGEGSGRSADDSEPPDRGRVKRPRELDGTGPSPDSHAGRGNIKRFALAGCGPEQREGHWGPAGEEDEAHRVQTLEPCILQRREHEEQQPARKPHQREDDRKDAGSRPEIYLMSVAPRVGPRGQSVWRHPPILYSFDSVLM